MNKDLIACLSKKHRASGQDINRLGTRPPKSPSHHKEGFTINGGLPVAKDIRTATLEELTGVMNVTSVGLDTRVNKGQTVTIDENITVITKEQQDFLRLVLREARRRLLEMGGTE